MDTTSGMLNSYNPADNYHCDVVLLLEIQNQSSQGNVSKIQASTI